MSTSTAPTSAPPSTGSPTAAWVPLAVSVGLFALGAALSATAADRVEVEDVVDGAMLMLFPALGALLLRRGRVPRVARLFQTVGALTGVAFLAGGAAEHEWAARSVSGVLATVAFVAMISVLLSVTPLFFPDDELPSRRWRPALWLSVSAGVAACVAVLLMPGPVDEDSAELGTNPLGLAFLQPVLEVVETAAFIGFAVGALLALVSLLARLRGATATDRRRVAILGAGVAVLVGLFLLDSTLQSLGGDTYGVVAAVVALGAVPVAAGIALLRE